MKTLILCIQIFTTTIMLMTAAQAQEPIYWDVIQKIRVEGLKRSQIMKTASYITDVYGPRLANSPSYQRAAEWAKQQFEEYGLLNVHLDSYGEFGVTWSNEYTSVHMMTPQYMPVIAYPNTFSFGTNRKVRGPVVYINFAEISSRKDLNVFKGELHDAIVFIEPKVEMKPHFEPIAVRYTRDQLDDMSKANIARPGLNQNRPDHVPQTLPRKEIIDFLFSEGTATIVSPDRRGDYGTVTVNEVPGRAWEGMDSIHPPYLVMAGEHYNRIMRILEKGIDVEMEVETRVTVHADSPEDFNVIADLEGSDLRDEVVMIGGHFDANSAGQGAIDNGAGSAVAMEAIRILKAIGVKPRRTIRVALWGGEEYGLYGSRGYVRKYLGDPDTQKYTAAHSKFAGYFNNDTVAGKIRGIWLQENERVRPIFEAWIKPFNDLRMTHISPNNSPGSDHNSFDAVGLPGFRFIQDDIERRAYHTNMDTYDRYVPQDLMQAAVIMASFAYHTAMRSEKLPRIAPSGERTNVQ